MTYLHLASKATNKEIFWNTIYVSNVGNCDPCHWDSRDSATFPLMSDGRVQTSDRITTYPKLIQNGVEDEWSRSKAGEQQADGKYWKVMETQGQWFSQWWRKKRHNEKTDTKTPPKHCHQHATTTTPSEHRQKEDTITPPLWPEDTSTKKHLQWTPVAHATPATALLRPGHHSMRSVRHTEWQPEAYDERWQWWENTDIIT